jgi:hypothetical protein
MRHNFHEQREALYRNPKHVLPDDINAPVLAFLEKVGCGTAVELIKKMQAAAAHGKVEIVRLDRPAAKLTINVSYGMAEGWSEYEEIVSGNFRIYKYKTVKNSNLDKKNHLRKEETE